MADRGKARLSSRRCGMRVRLLSSMALALFSMPGALIAAPALPGFPAVPTAPANAPNVLVIMTDDVGFAAGSTFGGAIPTPTMDRLAENGLRYSNFHTTSLCSPTRAALLTGRNHHAVGNGGVADFARGLPGYNAIIPKSAATLGQILKANGYNTAMFGKNHNVPSWQSGPLGPFDQWGSGLGFDYFYGFHGGMTDQFAPALIENNNMVEPPKQPGYILDRDLADHAVQWLRMQRAQSGGKPFFLYYAPGTAHDPIQAPAEWLAKFRGRFDAGWDAYRTESFERQKRLGVIPQNATLAPMPAGFPSWSSLSADQKQVYARYMEAYAAALAYCDDQIGRLIEDLRNSGQLDNTLVIYIQGDNGASPEGGMHGSLNYAELLGKGAETKKSAAEAMAAVLPHLDEIGGPRSYPAVPVGWSLAMNTPFPYFKMMPSRLGGVRNGMVISWPRRIAERGLRTQFTHVVDIAPTVLEAAGIKPPETMNSMKQVPFDGMSFSYSFAQPRAPSRHRTQYFEVAGNAALYQDGWWAASPVGALGQKGAMPPALEPKWQLYDLTTDSSQTIDLADRNPEKLRALRRVFDAEAKRNHVLPISSDTQGMLLPGNRPEVTAMAGRYMLYPSSFRYSEGTFPSINNRSWSLDADLDVPANGGNGVLITQGGQFSGWGLVMLQGVPTFLYRLGLGEAALTRLAAPERLAPGSHKVQIAFTVDGVGLGRGGVLKMLVDGKQVAETRLDRTVAFKFSLEDGSIGHDTGTSLIDDYQVPFAFDGVLRSVTVDLQPAQTPK